MAVVLLSKRERGQDRMIVHDSDVGYNTRHDRIDMFFNFDTSAKVTSSTTVELSGSQQDSRWGAELNRHESGLKRVAVPRRRQIQRRDERYVRDPPSPSHCVALEPRLVTAEFSSQSAVLLRARELNGR